MTSTRARKTLRDDSGHTIVEVLVAFVVILIVMVSSAAVFVRVNQSLRHDVESDRASQLAVERIERIRQLNWHDIGFYKDTYNSAISSVPSGADAYSVYANKATGNNGQVESPIYLGNTDPHTDATCNGCANSKKNRILPYEHVASTDTSTYESRDNFHVYTTITWGIDTKLGLPVTTCPATASGHTCTYNTSGADDLYSFKRVIVTVVWYTKGTKHTIVNTSTFAPKQYDEAPPGVNVVPQDEDKAYGSQ